MIMKNLYESILSSTNSGKVSFAEMIKNAEVETDFTKQLCILKK